jgi:intracellular multiplication protein IcmK
MGGTLMNRFVPLIIALLIGTSSYAWAQTNTGKAPLLPPPPTSALEPIPTPAAATSTTTTTTAMTPVTNLDGKTTQTTVTQKTAATPAATTTATTTTLPPVAQSMGGQQTSTTVTTATPAGAPELAGTNNQVTGTTTATAGVPIALPGMPSTEAGLKTNSPYGATPASTTIDPGLVGADGSYDQQAYEEKLKERLAELKVQTREKALEKATTSTFPMQPNEIEDVIRQLRKTQAAIQKPIEVPPPTPRAVVHTMELDPGAQPPTIQLLNGNVTSVSILDATGQPWPIVDIAFGGAFDIKAPEAGGHIIRISPLKEYARGNMSVRLQKLATPLTFSLDAGGQEVHYRFDARVPQLGPNAKTSLINRGLTITAGEDTDLSAILVGTPPASAERLKVTGVDGRTSAYRLNGSTYVRTPHTLLSPTWDGSVSSADGTHVYKLPEAPVLLLSDDGVMVRAQIQQPVIDPYGLPDSQKAMPSATTVSPAASTLSSGDRG